MSFLSRLASVSRLLGMTKERATVPSLNDWLFGFGDWSADGKGLLVPSFTPEGSPVILEVSRTGKASVILEGAPSTAFDSMIRAPDGHYGILGAAVPGDNNAWMVDNF